MRPSELVADPRTVRRAAESRHPSITPRWVRTVLFEGRMAFEDEMERERKRLLNREFDRFWRKSRAQHA